MEKKVRMARFDERDQSIAFSERTRLRLHDFAEDLRELDRLLERLIDVLREKELANKRANDLARGRSGGAGGEGDRDR